MVERLREGARVAPGEADAVLRHLDAVFALPKRRVERSDDRAGMPALVRTADARHHLHRDGEVVLEVARDAVDEVVRPLRQHDRDAALERKLVRRARRRGVAAVRRVHDLQPAAEVVGVFGADIGRQDGGGAEDGRRESRRQRGEARHQLQTSIGPFTPICAGARFVQPSAVIATGFSQRRPNVGEVTNVSIWNVMFGWSS